LNYQNLKDGGFRISLKWAKKNKTAINFPEGCFCLIIFNTRVTKHSLSVEGPALRGRQGSQALKETMMVIKNRFINYLETNSSLRGACS